MKFLQLNFQLLAAALFFVVAGGKLAADDAKPSLAGAWRWTILLPDGTDVESTAKLKLEGEKVTGTTVRGTSAELPVSDGHFRNGEVRFSVIRDRDGVKSTNRFHGQFAGDTIKGKLDSNFGGKNQTFDWDARRITDAPDAAGTWRWNFTRGDGLTVEGKARLKQDGGKLTGVAFGQNGGETPITDGQLQGTVVSFKVVRERDDQTFTTRYEGKLDGDTIKGTSEADFGGSPRVHVWEAKRARRKP